MAGFNPEELFGLTSDSSNEVICRHAFDFVRSVGYMCISTVDLQGFPTSRFIEVQSLDLSGDLYLGISKGKPIYHELKKLEYITASIVKPTDNGLSIAVRITSKMTEIIDDKGIYDAYWKINQGTMSMYRKDLSNFRVFKLAQGDGEIFHVHRPDMCSRLRFSFGGGSVRPWAYEIGENCTGCGQCAKECMSGIIEIKEGRAVIDYSHCLECGRCKDICPCGAIQGIE